MATVVAALGWFGPSPPAIAFEAGAPPPSVTYEAPALEDPFADNVTGRGPPTTYDYVHDSIADNHELRGILARLSGLEPRAPYAYDVLALRVQSERAATTTGSPAGVQRGGLSAFERWLVAANAVDDGAFRLIGANRAEIDPRKFTEYALNPNHAVGGNKARVFESAFGFNRSNADDLIAQLRQGVMEQTPTPGVVDKFGSRFTVDIPVAGPSGSGTVRTGWIYDPGSITPRLTTAFPR